MSFRIGQRVRLILVGWTKVPSGAVGTVDGVIPAGATFAGQTAVRFDSYPSGYIADQWGGTDVWACRDSYLAPIDDDDSHKVVAWDECAWQPRQHA